MTRVKSGVITKRRHRKVLRSARGYYGAKSKLFKSANEQLLHSGAYAFRDRRRKKRDFRRLWIARINAGLRRHGVSYSDFIGKLKAAKVDINRKVLADLAARDTKAFDSFVKDVLVKS